MNENTPMPLDLANTAPAVDSAASAIASPAAETYVDPWQAISNAAGSTAPPDWLDTPTTPALHDAATNTASQVWHQLLDGSLPVEAWINQGLGWVVEHWRPFFQSARLPIDGTLNWMQGLLGSLSAVSMIALIGLLAWQFAGRRIALGATASLVVVALLGIWSEAMVTLSLVLTSLLFCLLIGLPLGVLLASSDRAQRLMRPLLDAMQTTPAFVYLVPVVMLFGIGNVPGVIVTIVFALAPLARLTSLGLRQVRPDLIEAARAYGASPWQMLVKVRLPLALPSIMAGINQALMMSLSMVVIASMIAVGGLGQMVLRGIGRLDMGLATVGGLGIVLLAITLDRITQAMGATRRAKGHRWWRAGPAGLVLRAAQRLVCAPAPASPARLDEQGASR